MIESPIFFIVGPTGSGKSVVAVKVAKTLHEQCGYENVVIVNCDVMQFYEGLPVATNKVSAADMENIPHMFLGFLDINGEPIRDPTMPYVGCDKSNYQSLRSSTTASQENRRECYNVHLFVKDFVAFAELFFGKYLSAAIVVCGGTCYYAQALLFENVLTTEDSNKVTPSIEKTVENLHKNIEEENDWEKLNTIDPVIASRYHPNDQRRIERLLQIYEKTGRLPSEIFSTRNRPSFRFPPERCFVFLTRPDFEELKGTLDGRVDQMVGRGIVAEFSDFIKKNGVSVLEKTIGEAIGFKEFFSAFNIEGSDLSLKGPKEMKESIDKVKSNTRRYARQQMQWIKKFYKGKFRDVFISQQGKRKFLAFNSLAPVSNVLKTVEYVTTACVKNEVEKCSSDILSFPLEEDAESLPTQALEWCTMCQEFIWGLGKLDTHLSSKRHRSAVRHDALVKRQKEYYGRDIPPKKRFK